MNAPILGKITQSGVYDLPFQEYLGQPCDALSMGSSDAQLLTIEEKTPAHLVASWNEPEKVSKVADIGSVAHELLLQPNCANRRIVVVKADNFKKKATQELRDAILNEGNIPILGKDFDTSRRIVDAVMSHPVAAALLRNGEAERSWFWKDPKTGLYKKCRPDFFTAARILIDIKTVGSAAPTFLKRRVQDGGWFMQAPWYCEVIERVDGKPAAGYCWIIAEQEPPHAVVVRKPPEVALIHGDRLNKQAWSIFTRCVERNEWPAYGDEIEDLGLPDFAYYRLEEDAIREDDARKLRGMEAVRLAEETGGHVFG